MLVALMLIIKLLMWAAAVVVVVWVVVHCYYDHPSFLPKQDLLLRALPSVVIFPLTMLIVWIVAAVAVC